MNPRRALTVLLMSGAVAAASAIGILSADCSASDRRQEQGAAAESVVSGRVPPSADTLPAEQLPIDPSEWEGGKAQMPASDADSRYTGLTDEDFAIVARELNVEVAAIKAVVRVEAGASMEGFWAPGVPVVNFDRTLYNAYGRKGANRAGNPKAQVPKGLKGFPLKKWTKLTQMRRQNAEGADMGTLWGMFQIGGFNYRTCGCKTIQEFVELMSRSEFDQLELFAAFVVNTGMVDFIRRKDWAGFSRRFNGPSYARRGYHTRMARAYASFKN